MIFRTKALAASVLIAALALGGCAATTVSADGPSSFKKQRSQNSESP